jgi:hypothetical protein
VAQVSLIDQFKPSHVSASDSTDADIVVTAADKGIFAAKEPGNGK